MTPPSPNPDQPQTRYEVLWNPAELEPWKLQKETTNDPVEWLHFNIPSAARCHYRFRDPQGVVWRVEPERDIMVGYVRQEGDEWLQSVTNSVFTWAKVKEFGLPYTPHDVHLGRYRRPAHLLPDSPAPTFNQPQPEDYRLSQAEVEMRATTVCLCGSSRWPEIHMRVMMQETLAGRIVIPMGLYGHADFPPGARAVTNDGDESTKVKQMLDQLHFAKIDKADEIIVVRVDGYIGSSTKREIEYAKSKGKAVRFHDEVPPSHAPAGPTPEGFTRFLTRRMSFATQGSGMISWETYQEIVEYVSELQRQRDEARKETKAKNERIAELWRQKVGFLGLYDLLPNIENQYEERPVFHIREEINRLRSCLSSLQSQATRDAEEIKWLKEELAVALTGVVEEQSGMWYWRVFRTATGRWALEEQSEMMNEPRIDYFKTRDDAVEAMNQRT